MCTSSSNVEFDFKAHNVLSHTYQMNSNHKCAVVIVFQVQRSIFDTIENAHVLDKELW